MILPKIMLECIGHIHGAKLKAGPVFAVAIFAMLLARACFRQVSIREKSVFGYGPR